MVNLFSLVSALGMCMLLGTCGSLNTSDPSRSSKTSSSTSSSSISSSSSSTSSSSNSSSGSASVFPASVTRPKIMIVGDSISAGPGCYKKYLDKNLKDNGITNYDFVGEYADDCGGGIKHSAVSCSTSGDFTKASFTLSNCFQGQSFKGISQLMPAHRPDMVLLQLGVNDIWGGNTPVQNVLDNYTKLVQQMRQYNPNIVVVTAQIHKVITDQCLNQKSYQNAEALVNSVPDWAAGISTKTSLVFVADLWSNSDPKDAKDCVHPEDAGAQKIGYNWYQALKNIL